MSSPTLSQPDERLVLQSIVGTGSRTVEENGPGDDVLLQQPVELGRCELKVGLVAYDRL
jgi:hypothetical protein